jgi:acyl-CoA-binding protein
MSSTIPGLSSYPDISAGKCTNNQTNITDIILVTSKDQVPTGYEKIEKNSANRRCGLHAHGPDQGLFLCVQRDPNGTPVTGIMFVCDEYSESPAPGYIRVERTLSGKWAGIRSEKDHTRMFLCIKKGGTSPPIYNIDFISPNKNEKAPKNYFTVNTSPSGLDVSISSLKGSGSFILCYEQRLLDLGNRVAKMPALGRILRALYTHDQGILSHCLFNLLLMIKNPALFVDDGEESGKEKKDGSTSTAAEAEAAAVAGSIIVNAVCDATVLSSSHHIDLMCNLLLTFVGVKEFLAPNKGSPNTLLRIIETITYLEATYASSHTTTIKANKVRETLENIMLKLMERADVTNPLGIDQVVEGKLRLEAAAKSKDGGPVEYCIELILARVYELRSAMVAAHDAVTTSLTLGGASGSSTPYSNVWRQRMDEIGRRLFPGHTPPRDIFISLAFLCQLCHVETKMDGYVESNSGSGSGNLFNHYDTSPTLQSDLRTKISALQSLRVLLESSGVGFRQGVRSGLVVRGLVVQVILENCSAQSMDIFREVLGLITCLWTSFRRHLKVELTILFQDVLLRVLRSPYAPLQKKVDVLEQLINHWFAQPANLVELYLNFDNDQVEVSDANIYSGLCEVLCALAEGRFSVEDGRIHHYHHDDDQLLMQRKLRRVALDALARVTRCLMDTSATVHLMNTGDAIYLVAANASQGSVGWENEGRSSLLQAPTSERSSIETNKSTKSIASSHGRTYSPYESALVADEIRPESPHGSISSNDSTSGSPPNITTATTTNNSTRYITSGKKKNLPIHNRGRSHSDLGPVTPSPLWNTAATATRHISSNSLQTIKDDDSADHPILARRASVRIRHVRREEKQKNAEKAIELANKKSLKKAFRLLVESGHVTPSVNEFCNWIRDHIDALDENAVGDYLGEEGVEKVSPSGVVARSYETIEFFTNMRNNFMGTMSFEGVGFVSALRSMLTESGFRMPGEAQKVGRFLESFAICYHNANKEIDGLDTVDKCEILSFATVMLNTDRYNPAIKPKKKMTAAQFKRNMRGQGVSNEFLDKVFNDIISERIAMPIPGQPVVKGGTGGNDGDSDEDDLDSDHSLSLYYRSMQNAAQRARAKLNGHSSMCRVYFNKMSTELVNLMFEISWPFFYRCITVVLDEQDSKRSTSGRSARNNDEVQHLELVACVLDLLRYSISACLCLGMETERRAFAALLAKFHFLHSNSGEWESVGDVMVFGHEDQVDDEKRERSNSGVESGDSVKSKDATTRDILSGKHLEQTWFKHVMQTSAHDSDAVMDVISEVHQLASRLRDRVMHQYRSKFLLKLCQTRFVKNSAEQILNFQGKRDRSLMKEGIMIRHTQTGREKKYRFFLFSDLFLYASGGRSKLKVHNYLPLTSLRIREAPQEDGLNPNVSFQIESPVKSFAISASTPAKKRSWMEAIEHACRQQEIDTLEEEKKLMMERGGSGNGSSGSGKTLSTSDGGNRWREKGRKRNSLISRFELTQEQNNEDVKKLEDLTRRQSELVSSSVLGKASSESPLSSPVETKVIAPSNSENKKENKKNPFMNMTDDEVKIKFGKGLKYSKSILEGTHPTYVANDDEKLLFYGIFKQATMGDCTLQESTDVDWIRKAKISSWKEQRGITKRKAQEKFLTLLRKVGPEWDNE